MNPIHDIISFGHIENELMYPHRNPGMELVLIDQGHLEWAVDQVPEILNPGTVFFTLPWQTHGSLQIREPRNKIYYTLFCLENNPTEPQQTIRFPRSLQFSAAEERILSTIYTSAPQHTWPASPLLKQIFPELIHKLSGSTELDGMAATNLLRTTLIELAHIIQNAPHMKQHHAASTQKVRRFLKNLHAHIDQPWTLADMAQECGIKRTQFTKITRLLTGYPPVQYLNRVRFERACELLIHSQSSITDIALECGHSSSQYFADVFRKFARMTPTEFRQHQPDLQAIMQANWSLPHQRTIADEQQRAKHFSAR